jgi:hypothetical protein
MHPRAGPEPLAQPVDNTQSHAPVRPVGLARFHADPARRSPPSSYRSYPPMRALTHAAGTGTGVRRPICPGLCEVNGRTGRSGCWKQARRSARTGVSYPAELSTREGVILNIPQGPEPEPARADRRDRPDSSMPRSWNRPTVTALPGRCSCLRSIAAALALTGNPAASPVYATALTATERTESRSGRSQLGVIPGR